MNQPTFRDLPRRTQNRARTRVNLVEALLPRLSEMPLDDIPVSELAADAEISEATFFNYFPTKRHLLTHFIQLWGLRMGALARRVHRESDTALGAIEALFLATAEDLERAPNVMLEIIAHQARQDPGEEAESIELAERLLFLPDEPDVMSLSDGGLGGLLRPWLAEAVVRGELPPETEISTVSLAAASVFFGVPLILGRQQPAAVGPLYRQQLRLLWTGARASA